MGIERWGPFREMIALRDSLNRLFDEALMRPGASGSPACASGSR